MGACASSKSPRDIISTRKLNFDEKSTLSENNTQYNTQKNIFDESDMQYNIDKNMTQSNPQQRSTQNSITINNEIQEEDMYQELEQQSKEYDEYFQQIASQFGTNQQDVRLVNNLRIIDIVKDYQKYGDRDTIQKNDHNNFKLSKKKEQ